MKKIISAACLFMLCSMTMAQTIKVVSTQGKTTSYDASKLDSISFNYGTRGFSVHSGDSTDTYTFDKVTSLNVDSKYLFAHPDTVYVGDHTQKFAFQLNTNVEYDATPSNAWLRADGNVTGSDSLRFIATNNPLMTSREGKIIFVNSNDDTMRDTLVVVQAGKTDTHFIDIDWNKATLNSFNENTGQCVITFQGDVPEMGQYDAFLLPTDNSYIIRVVNNATYVGDSKTVTLATREGKMGNLFKGKKFTLCSDPNYSEAPAAAPALARRAGIADAGTIYYPETIELCADGKPFAVVYDRSKADGSRRAQLSKEYNIFEYSKDNSGEEIGGGLSWETCTFDVGLKGVFQFDFGDIPWEQVRFGDLIDMKAYLEGDFNTELILKYALSAGIEWSAEKVLKEDIFSYRVKFMVGLVPVWINISSDLMAGAEASANGEISITGGVKASANLKAGMQWSKATGVTPIYEFEKNWELVEPEVKAEAHAEAKAYTWPRIKIGIYDVLCPTIDPKPYIRAYADARAEEIPYFGWDAGLTAGVDLTLGLSLDLFFFEKEIADIEPITLVDVDLVKLPQRIDMLSQASRNVMVGDTCHVIYRVMAKNRLTNSEFPLPGALLHVEKAEGSGGTIDSDQKFNDNPEWCYTNAKGEVTVVYTQNDTIPAKINVTLMTGDEEKDIEVPEWSCTIKDYRLTALDVDETENSITARSSGKADIRFLMEEYTKASCETDGRWLVKNDVDVDFKATGGTLEANKDRTKNGGYAIAHFDGGDGYDGKGTLDASVYIAEFDTTIVATTVKIDKFKFEDAGLNKCYNLSDNTASFRGNTLNVEWNSHVYNSWRDEIDFSFELEGPMSGSRTETGTSSGSYYDMIDNEMVWYSYEEQKTTSYTYKKQHVSCYRFNDYHYAMDSKFTAEGYGPFWLKQYDIYDSTTKISGTKTFSNDGHKESYSSTTSGEGQDFFEWPNSIVFDGGQGGYAVFEEGGKIIYLVYYVSSSNPQYNYYVKAVFDKASNTVND